LELGTGSGCIGLTLLKELNIAVSHLIGVDISEDAITVARKNANALGVSDHCQFVQSNWFEDVGPQKFDLILSNPPYICALFERDLMAIETIKYEPEIALYASNNGLEAYEVIAKSAKKFLAPNGYIFLEIGFGQAD